MFNGLKEPVAALPGDAAGITSPARPWELQPIMRKIACLTRSFYTASR